MCFFRELYTTWPSLEAPALLQTSSTFKVVPPLLCRDLTKPSTSCLAYSKSTKSWLPSLAKFTVIIFEFSLVSSNPLPTLDSLLVATSNAHIWMPSPLDSWSCTNHAFSIALIPLLFNPTTCACPPRSFKISYLIGLHLVLKDLLNLLILDLCLS